jgi:hypothetical protein
MRVEALQWILSPEPERQPSAVPVIEDVLVSSDYNEAACKQTWLRRALVVSPATVQQVAVSTLGQRTNPAWSLVRKHRLTASNFGPVLAAVRRNRCFAFIAQVSNSQIYT